MDANLKQVLFDKMSFNNMNGKLVVKDGKGGYEEPFHEHHGWQCSDERLLLHRQRKEAGNESRIQTLQYRFLHKHTKNWIWCRKWLLSSKT